LKNRPLDPQKTFTNYKAGSGSLNSVITAAVVLKMVKINTRHATVTAKSPGMICPVCTKMADAAVYNKPVKIPQTAAEIIRLERGAPPQPMVTPAPQRKAIKITNHQVSFKPGTIPVCLRNKKSTAPSIAAAPAAYKNTCQ